MKKIFLLICLLFNCLFNINAQSINNDEIFHDSLRIISGENISSRFLSDNIKWTFGLVGYENIKAKNKEVHYILTAELMGAELTQQCTLFIKTNSNNTFILKSFTVKDNVAYFSIMERNLFRLSNGIEQIKIMDNNGYLEMGFKEDKFGKKIFKLYRMINNRLYRIR